jgi:hypothetical protein
MKRPALFLAVLLAVALAAPLSAQQLRAVVREITGKVEVKLPGRDWQPAAVGMVVPRGAMVSTGFSSRLVLELGLSRLTVNPLTRMLLDELVKKDSTNTASLTLKVGKVNAVVKSAAGERTDFTLKGPASTAAVRGTQFEYNGYELRVVEGVVRFVNLLSQSRDVGPGESSQTDGYTYPGSGDQGLSEDSSVPGAGGGLAGGGAGGGARVPVLTGTIAVTVQQGG